MYSRKMSEILLNAILNLFALQACMLGPSSRAKTRTILANYLSDHLRIAGTETYLQLFDTALDLHDSSDKATLLTRLRDVAANLKSLLPRVEQYVFLSRYLELMVRAHEHVMLEVVAVVAEGLAIEKNDLEELRVFCENPFDASQLSDNFLVHDPGAPYNAPPCRELMREDFKARFAVLRIQDVDSFFIISGDVDTMTLDSIPLKPGEPHLLQPGSILRDAHGVRIYHSEIQAVFLSEGHTASGLVFRGKDLDFCYPDSENGLHNFSFCERGGKLVGVIGVSGAGKSTLLSILNGQSPPDSGSVLVNGLDLYHEAERLEGIIGYVPQDDLLFEDLTVFDNLYYNASLCLANLSPDERARRVDAILDELHQLDIRDLKVGSPLEKTISGGQRKRLNIALELIREPSILFVDEPTSGLSSSDSENVMVLLKAQAAKGKLVIVVIHQPSSRIYKMFDTLWILDQGGRPIYDGNPLDAIVYFRTAIHQAGMEEYACPHCGNVNPEQLFEIIEARAIDDSGHYTRNRLVSSRQWHSRYLDHRQKKAEPQGGMDDQAQGVERRLWRPGRFGQLSIFFMRNLKGRLANRQYLLINLIEPPLLAFLVALISHGSWGGKYAFMENINLGTYFFISVIVALFLGLSVSAEEINRDLKILKRERFLHLSWPCYIASKMFYLAIVVAIQMALYTLVGNPVLEIPDMFWSMWVVLFSCSVFSCVLGLNISVSFKSAVTIYILIPLLLVPQIMLGGAAIPYDEVMHKQAGNRNTPLVANIMPSRWGYEALVVDQYVSNRFMKQFLDDYCMARQNSYLADIHIPEMRSLADFPFLESEISDREAKLAQKLAALRNEVSMLERVSGVAFDMDTTAFNPENYTIRTRNRVKEYMNHVGNIFRQRRKEASQRKRDKEQALRAELGGQGFNVLKRENFNKDIAKLVLNKQTLENVRLSGDRLVQVVGPICQKPESRWGEAHFLAAQKQLGPWTIDTAIFNVAVLWCLSALFYMALYFSLFPRLLHLGAAISKRLRKSNNG
ncbi:MAG: ATP-binding cassette domain-containing protein [Planctomycetaceae bacterium]|nr:MAG: ATP-binding cassette domain-containing protein [Planctomycetaceae bacterium]